jgi:hypothetical protein
MSFNNPFDNYWKSSVRQPDDTHTARDERLRSSQTGQQTLLPRPAAQPIEEGTIVKAYPANYCYDVACDLTGTIPNVKRMTQSSSDLAMLAEGTQVAVIHGMNGSYIAGVLPHSTTLTKDDNPTTLTGLSGSGADDPLRNDAKGAGNYAPPGAPRDLSPNDWATTSPAGNSVAVLDGGSNLIKSSDFAQVRTHMVNDVVEIISQRYRHIHGMGFSEIKDEGGRMSYIFRGGADQTTEVGADQENWTIRLDMGQTGDLFRFELTQPDGASVFRIHVTPDGKAEMFAAKGFAMSGGEDETKKALGDETTEVQGNATRTIKGKETHTTNGERVVTVSANDSRTVGTDGTESFVRHYTKSVGGDAKYSFVGGNPVTALPTNTALEYEIVNGSWKINIGDPTSAASPAALAGFEMKTFTGDIYLGATVKGNITFETLLGDGVFNADTIQLGGSVGKEPFVCGDLLMEVLGQLVDAIMALTVPTSVGPSGPPLNMAAFTKLKGLISAGYPLSTFITGQKLRTPI